MLTQAGPRITRIRGQNLAELALTFPILIVLILATVEFGRVWQAFQGAKLAAVDGAHTAAINQNVGAGQAQLTQRLASANLQGNGTVTTPDNGRTYTASVNVTFTPLFPGVQIPVVGGTVLTIIPNSFPITYTSESTFAVY
jgi:Flp pilus assembly protein TadG